MEKEIIILRKDIFVKLDKVFSCLKLVMDKLGVTAGDEVWLFCCDFFKFFKYYIQIILWLYSNSYKYFFHAENVSGREGSYEGLRVECDSEEESDDGSDFVIDNPTDVEVCLNFIKYYIMIIYHLDSYYILFIFLCCVFF